MEAEGDVGVGGGAVCGALDAEVGVNHFDGGEESGTHGETATGAGAGFANATGDSSEGRLFVFPVAGAGDGGVEDGGHPIKKGLVDGAEIEARAGERSDGVDADAAFDNAEIKRVFGAGGREIFREYRDHAGDGMDGIGDTVIDPAMATGALDGYFVAAAGEGFVGDVFGGGAIEDEEGAYLGSERGLGAEVAHAAQVAVTLFADIGDEDGGGGEAFERRRGFQGADEGEETGEAGAVVTDPGADEGAVGFRPNIVGGAGREDGVQVGGEGDERRRGVGLEEGDDVAGLIDFRVAAELAEGGEHPFGAFLLLEGGRRDAAEFEVFFVNPLLVAAELVEGFLQAAGRGEGVEVTGCRGGHCP